MKINYDPQVEAFIKQMQAVEAPPIHTLPLEQVREMFAQMNAVEVLEEVGKIEDRTIPGPAGEIPIRVYYPEFTTEELLPVVIYYHGGGWVVGSIESYDPFCRKLVNRLDSIVISVEYRLAPEHKFPAAVEDSVAAFEWISENAESLQGDPNRIAVSGDSAGGNLAAVVAYKFKDHPTKNIVHQLLYYPTTGVGETKSYKDFGPHDPIIPTEVISFFRNHYWRDPSDEKHPDYSVYSYDDFTNLAPVTIIAAEYDPSLDDSKMYAQKLIEHGIDVEYKVYKGMIHGFATMDIFDKGKEALEDSCASLKRTFNKIKPTVLG